MSLYNGPARGGNRGGKDQFNWESVKSDKDREFYLGHSVKATTGRWQKGKDVFWYTREKQEEEAAKARLEMQAIKQREEDLMNEALGLKPKTIKQGAKPKLDSQDMAKLLGRTEAEDQGQPDPMQDPDAVKGLGYAPNMMTGVQSAGHDVLGGIGVDDDGPATRPQDNGAAETLPGPPPKLTQADRERMLKEQQKRVKKAKKEAKKAKKAAKKAKKSKDKERLQPAELAQHSSKPEASAASDASTSSDSALPPRYSQHASNDREARHEQHDGDSYSHRRETGRHGHSHGRDRYNDHEADGRSQQHARSSHRHRSTSPGRQTKRHQHAPEPHRLHSNGSRYPEPSRHRQSHNDQHHDRRRHDSPSDSPPRRRHRSRSPA